MQPLFWVGVAIGMVVVGGAVYGLVLVTQRRDDDRGAG